MAPELLNTIDAEELKSLATRVHEYQVRKELSDNALCRKFAGLGSSTSYKLILKGDLAKFDLETQLAKYRSVVALIEAIGDELQEEEKLIDDLVGPLELRRAFLETAKQATIARVIIVEGDTGSGKTQTGKLLVARITGRFIWTEASVAWGDKPKAMLDAFLRAMGMKELPTSTAGALEECVIKFNSTRIATVIDEAHHLGPNCLNTIKTLVNRTSGEFILLAMKTLWARLERTAYQEVRQLTGNRLAERIKLSLREPDVAKMIRERLELSGDLKKAVATIMPHAEKNGNLGFVRNVINRARQDAEGEAVTLEMFVTSVQAEVNRR